jgi:hypothetical protein
MPALPLAIQAMDLSRRHSLVPVEFMGTLIRGTVALSVEVALAVAAGVRRELASAKRFAPDANPRTGSARVP